MDIERTQENPKLGKLRQFLLPGEMLLWHGASQGGMRLLEREKKRIPYTIFLFCFAIFITARNIMIHDTQNIPYTVIIVPLSAISLLFERLLLPPLRRRSCYYGITNRRVILMKGKQFSALTYDQITELGLERHKGQLGTIHLTPPAFEMRKGRQWETDQRHSLLFIQECFRVYDLIEAQKEQYKQTTLSENK